VVLTDGQWGGAEAIQKECVLEAQVEDALQGCELEHSQAAETITGNYETKCNLCQVATWVDVMGIQPVQDVNLIPRSYTGINERYLKDCHAIRNIPKADIIV